MGFIGSYICDELLNYNEQVIVLDYRKDNLYKRILSPEKEKELIIIEGDYTDSKKVSKTIIDYKIDKIIHLASNLHPYCNENPKKYAILGNILGHQIMLEAARKYNVKKFVWASTSVVFGPYEKQYKIPVPNDAGHNYVNIYGSSKSFCEALAINYSRKWDIDTLGLRYNVVYGIGRTRGATNFFNDAIAKIALGEPAEVLFAEDIIDWQYVRDIARLTVKASKVEKTENRIFNTRCDVRIVKDGVNFLKKIFPEAIIKLNHGKFGVAWDCDDSELQREIGFKP